MSTRSKAKYLALVYSSSKDRHRANRWNLLLIFPVGRVSLWIPILCALKWELQRSSLGIDPPES